MNFIPVIDCLATICCVVILVSTVIPLCMMPYRMFQVFRDKVELELECGEHTYNPIFAWLVYGLTGGGVVFSLHRLGLIDRGLAFDVASFASCLWIVLLLVCFMAAGIYKRIARRRGALQRKARETGICRGGPCVRNVDGGISELREEKWD